MNDEFLSLESNNEIKPKKLSFALSMQSFKSNLKAGFSDFMRQEKKSKDSNTNS